MYLIAIGAYADIYLNPNEGLHIQPFLGWGGLELSVNGDAGGSDPTGFLLALGVGNDWWMSPEWSIGAMGRLTYGAFSLNDVSYSTIAPSVLATFTYH